MEKPTGSRGLAHISLSLLRVNKQRCAEEAGINFNQKVHSRAALQWLHYCNLHLKSVISANTHIRASAEVHLIQNTLEITQNTVTDHCTVLSDANNALLWHIYGTSKNTMVLPWYLLLRHPHCRSKNWLNLFYASILTLWIMQMYEYKQE